MTEIPLYKSFLKIEPITKGMSGDKKYYIETVDGKHMLLRVADSSEYSQKRTKFDTMKHLVSLGVPMPSPIDFGTCDNGKCVYRVEAEIRVKRATRCKNITYQPLLLFVQDQLHVLDQEFHLNL